MTSLGGMPHDPPPGDLGQRLATWLQGLGLASQLAGAGLPTFERDDLGRAVWTDPATGDVMTADQLQALDALLRSEGDDPAFAVPVSLVGAARESRLRAELLTSPCLTYATLAERRGTSLDATRFVVHKTASDNRLLIVNHEGTVLVPAFQLTAAGEPRPDLAPVLSPLLAGGMDPWKAWIWLTQPAGLLGGLVPEQAAADPETADLVAHAAVRLAERVVGSS